MDWEVVPAQCDGFCYINSELVEPGSLAAFEKCIAILPAESCCQYCGPAPDERYNTDMMVSRYCGTRKCKKTTAQFPLAPPGKAILSKGCTKDSVSNLLLMSRKARLNETAAGRKVGAMLKAKYGDSACPNGMDACDDGYFCVNNVLCLEGDPSQYTPFALFVAGAVTQLATDLQEVQCLLQIDHGASDIDAALNESGDYPGSNQALSAAVSDMSSVIQQCEEMDQSWWQDIESIVEDVIDVLCPQCAFVIDATEYVIAGMDVFENVDGMLNSCSEDVQDYIDCGADFGNILDAVYEAS